MKTLRKINSAFTLIEVMVSAALIVVIMGFLMYTMEQTQRTMRGADSRIGQFQTARVAFEALTRNLSQATLNTYWDLDYAVKNGKLEPQNYRRNSDLHFVCGPASDGKLLDSNERINPTHAVFFQAPLGVSYQDENQELTSSGYKTSASETSDAAESKRKYRFLTGLMNVCGYYIQWGEDARVPAFLKADFDSDKINRRYRYRLMEVAQPAETVSIYNNPWYTKPKGKTKNFVASPNAGASSKPYLLATDWVKVAVGKLAPTLGPKTNYARPLADNIVAMIIVPKLPESDRDKPTGLDDLTRDFNYDSRSQKVYDAFQGDTPVNFKTLLTDKHEKRQYAQLPPIMQVTLVAIDEDSGAKLESSLSEPKSGPDEHWAKGLFKTLTDVAAFNADLGDPANPTNDSLLGRLSGLDRSLKMPKMNFRIFTTDVVMRSAKWTATETQ